MKLTKKLEEEIRQVYNTYWEGYMKGDMDTFSVILDEDVKVIGSTEGEVFFNKQEALSFYLPTADQIAGKAELRNRDITIEAAGNLVLVTEQNDFYILIEDNWTYYAKGRLSTFFHTKDGDWKIIQQHGSMPDIRAVEGEQFVLEKISKENLELRDAVKRRTVELEHKNRDLEIETSLERVRTVAMSMSKPDDMLRVCHIISDQLKLLQIQNIRNVQTLVINEPKFEYINYQYFTPYDKNSIEQIDYRLHPVELALAEKTLSSPDAVYVNIFKGKDLQVWRDHRRATHQLTDPLLDEVDAAYYYFYSIGSGAIGLTAYSRVTDEQLSVFRRFRNVFELAYRRYRDIEQAAAQAREAQIEASLERVRAVAMAMNKLDDMLTVCRVISEQMTHLGTKEIRNVQTAIFYPEKEIYRNYEYYRLHDKEMVTDVDYTTDKISSKFAQKMQAGAGEFFTESLKGEAVQEWYEFQKTTAQFPDHYLKNTQSLTYYWSSLGPVAMGMSTYAPLIDEEIELFKRFRNVFELAYRRFLDIQQATAQAREAQIELGLESVRARAMAMQKSDELKELIGTVFSELTKLDFVLTRCVIMIFDPSTNDSTWWMANSEAPSNPIGLFVQSHKLPAYLVYIKAWQERNPRLQYVLEGKIKKEWDEYLFSQTGLSELPDFVIEGMKTPDKVILASSFNNFGNLTLASLEALSEEHSDIMLRFAKVFDLTYTRFNDLQKAEAQAREATIEAALERVRGKAMAMHNSNDLAATASMVFTELRKLGIKPIRCGVGLLNKETRKAPLYSATSSADGDSLALVGWVMLTGHPVLENIYNSWLNNEDYFPELSGEQLRSYYEKLLSGLSVTVPDWQNGQKQFGHFIPFSIGCLYAWSEVPYNDQEIKVLKRFGSIIDLTFRRYLELQQSEGNAKAAVRQASLDRVRAEIASMRTTTDLEKITPLIWNELTTLDVPFIRCGVFIMDDVQRIIHTYLSTPDGKSIAAFHIPYTTPGNISEVINHWHKGKIYTDHWDENAFEVFAATLVQQKALVSSEQYLSTIPKGGFYLHFLPFLQGMLYVANTTLLKEEEIKLTQLVADAFSTAYARYEDFNKLESAKEQLEKTLTDLKQAQTQLIQSEKMASLGELTAGIAHEIQNPLNFVNNFSEVSTELLDEMITELRKNNPEDAITIADDVKQNLEKILHHGKRADGIVKGMLQHSRTSSGVKEPTNINTLADEYLRLAYHGLRAKDKSFNALLNTDYDETIGNIEIIPQDIGRVILNLITNAFYAVEEKRKSGEESYKPTVSVSTTGNVDKVEVKVKDNGIGISQKVMDKIFQPFFTTKPTGQGTGLGLSLSYDIIKAHGGELKVETGEGLGSEFIILLPR